MEEKRYTTILMVVFVGVLAYSVVSYDSHEYTGEQVRRMSMDRGYERSPVTLQPSNLLGSPSSNETNHTECINFQCLVRPGPGNNQCVTSADCQANITCGNGIVEPGEQCEFNSQCPSGKKCSNNCICVNSGFTITTGNPSALSSTTIPKNAKRVFVASTLGNGNLGGYQGGVNACNQLAASNGLGGSWVPWLSVNSTNSTNQSIHAGNTIPNVPYVRLDGIMVANDKQDLLDGTIDNPINIDETGILNNNAWAVMTGTNAQGMATGYDCNGWTDGSFNYLTTQGGPKNTNSSWTDYGPGFCLFHRSFYCFET
jgi:hypothetical protein